MAEAISSSLIHDFTQRHGLDLAAMRSCASSSRAVRKILRDIYESQPFSSDLDLVVFGSIFRNEYTYASDVDWTLLINGQADSIHLKAAKFIEEKIEELQLKKPSPAGTFGSITINHDLVHYIGGENDTNQNITRRVLLLLESEKIVFGSSQADGTVYNRTVNGVLGQYVNHDSGLLRPKKETIPKFLLNDMVRFWRTMCVDFANKQKDQGGQKWAMRNVKLRMSRKLLFVKGMLMCFNQNKVHTDPTEIIADLREMVKLHPFELLLLKKDYFELQDQDIISLLTYYDQFLSALSDPVKRESLTNLGLTDAFEDPLYKELKTVGDHFKKTLDQMFIYKKGKLSNLSLKYGIF